jgi:hypothetical protein
MRNGEAVEKEKWKKKVLMMNLLLLNYTMGLNPLDNIYIYSLFQ